MTSKLARACWPDVRAGAQVVLVPLGSCEQHGPHLPLATDTLVAEAVARRAAAELRQDDVEAWCAPAVPYGASGEHQDFPGTMSIGHDVLGRLLVEAGRSAATWGARLVFVNGHGGNLPTVGEAVCQLRHEGRDAAWLPCDAPGADAHAGRTETSLMLAIAPHLVRRSRARAGTTRPLAELLPRLRKLGVAAVSPNGVLGDPTGASAAEGALLLAGMTTEAVRAVLHGQITSSGRLRTFAGVPE